MLQLFLFPCSLAVRYIVFEYRTKVRSSIYNVSQMRTSWNKKRAATILHATAHLVFGIFRKVILRIFLPLPILQQHLMLHLVYDNIRHNHFWKRYLRVQSFRRTKGFPEVRSE